MYDLNSIWEFINKGGRGVQTIQAIKCNQLPIHRAIYNIIQVLFYHPFYLVGCDLWLFNLLTIC